MAEIGGLNKINVTDDDSGSPVSGARVVVFSDGEKADWSLDQMGRLALDARGEDYQPSESDLLEFQKKLSSLLQNQGY